jgi:hypothetical protein
VFEVYPKGTTKVRLFPTDVLRIPTVDPTAADTPKPLAPKLEGKPESIPLYILEEACGPIAQIAKLALYPALKSTLPDNVKPVKSKLPDPNHTTLDPDWKMFTTNCDVEDVGAAEAVYEFQYPFVVNQALAELAFVKFWLKTAFDKDINELSVKSKDL